MKKIFFLIISIALVISCKRRNAENEELTELSHRFDRFLNAASNHESDSIANYTYPKLIELKGRMGAIKHILVPILYFQQFWELDSIKRDSIYPVIKKRNERYTLITYTMVCTERSEITRSKEPVIEPGKIPHSIGLDDYPAPQVTLMRTLLRGKLNMELIDEYEMKGRMVSRLRGYCIAAKDKFAPEWSFFVVTEDQEILSKAFSAEILKELSKYNKE